MKNGDPPWTIDELTEAVATALAAGYGGAPNGRVRDVPDRRTIRYYTTAGLIDRPSEMRGRTALYDRRHLLQLVAIKKLQACGQSLAEIQRALAGQTDRALAEMAGLGGEELTSRPSSTPRPRPARDFWRQTPAVQVPAASSETKPLDRTEPARSHEIMHPQMFHGVPLAEGVTLLLASSRPIDGPDLEAVRAAAAPLLDTLTRRQLISPREVGQAGQPDAAGLSGSTA
jgi:DNA-binding transcriptional MerR regulator